MISTYEPISAQGRSIQCGGRGGEGRGGEMGWLIAYRERRGRGGRRGRGIERKREREKEREKYI